MRRLRFARLWSILAWSMVAVALYLSLIPPSTPYLRVLFQFNDKVEHALCYLVLTVWFTGLYPPSRYVWIAVALLAMGVAVEFLQGWMGIGRHKEARDVYADLAGIVLGLVLALTVLRNWMARFESAVTGNRAT